MGRFTRMIAAAVVLALLGVPSARGHAATGTVIDEGFLPTKTQGVLGLQAVRLRDTVDYTETVSVLRAKPSSSSGAWKSCSTITAGACTTAQRIDFSAILPPCAGASSLDCIVAFGTVDVQGNKVPATYVRAFPTAGLNDYPANSSLGLPVGGPGGLWTVASSSGAPVSLHYVRAVVAGTTTPGTKVTFTNFAANVSPVEMATMPCGDDNWTRTSGCSPGDLVDTTGEHHGGDTSGWAGFSDDYGHRHGLDCVMSGNYVPAAQTAECAKRKAMSRDVKYYVTVRMTQAVSGWMHGRMDEPSISLADVAGVTGAVELTVSAKAVSVPVVQVEKKFSELPANLQNAYRYNGGWPRSAGGYWDPADWGMADVDAKDPLKRNRESIPPSYGPDGIDELLAWMPTVNDTASADISTWSVRTLGSGELGAAQGCVTEKNKVLGIVTTNATQYKAGAPEFDQKTRTLNYKVAAPHYMSSGDVLKGTYGLIVRSDVARCIYGFSSAPVRATIEVIDTGADKSTIVTNISENNGWLQLMASGYTHSAPTIRAAIAQDGAASTTSSVAWKVGQTISKNALAKRANLTVAKSSRVSVSVAASSRTRCRMSGSTLRAVKKGTCAVTVTVVTGKSTKKKVLRLTVG